MRMRSALQVVFFMLATTRAEATEVPGHHAFTPSQGWILVRHGSLEDIRVAIVEYDGLTREIRPGVFRVELHPQRAGGVAILLPDGLPAYDLANLAGWLDAPPGREDDVHGAIAWLVSPTSGVKFSLVPEAANEGGDTMLGASRDGVSIRVSQPEGRASVIPQQVGYQSEPDIDIARDPVIMEVTLDTNPAFGNPGFVIEH